MQPFFRVFFIKASGPSEQRRLVKLKDSWFTPLKYTTRYVHIRYFVLDLHAPGRPGNSKVHTLKGEATRELLGFGEAIALGHDARGTNCLEMISMYAIDEGEECV